SPPPGAVKRFRWLEGDLKGPFAVAFSDDGRRVASADMALHVWDAETGKEIFRLGGLSTLPANIAFGPTANTLTATWDGQTVRTWDLESKTQLHDRPGPFLSLSGRLSLVFDHTGPDVYAQVWDVEMNKRIGRFFITSREDAGPSLPMRGAFSSDGNRIAAHSGSGLVAVFDLSRKVVRRVEAKLPNGAEMALSSDGKLLLAC